MHPATLFDPTALALVGWGTLLATALRSPVRDLVRAVAALTVLPRRSFSAEPLLRQLAAQAKLAERHGVMQLDRAVFADPDLAAAVGAIVDGASPDVVAALAEHRRRARIERHAAAADVWAGAAETAPAMGMVGTLIGLAAMFATMADPTKIGGAMAVALLATLYGALLSNLIAQPIAQRLRIRARREAYERSRLLPPLAALAAREAPRIETAARIAA